MLSKGFSLLKELGESFLHLIYPRLCVACAEELPIDGDCFCLRCRVKLHRTNMHQVAADNEFTARFWGKVRLEAGSAMYYFTRKSPIQHAVHMLKYKNRPDIGLQTGREFGRLLRTADIFKTVEGILPVPLHPDKERQRGYNQSEMLSQGLAEAMDIPLYNKVLVRRKYTKSQTRKRRMERFENVQQVFGVEHPERIRGKHVLLVDDVLTTGATLELCAHQLLAVPELRLSMAALAIAVR